MNISGVTNMDVKSPQRATHDLKRVDKHSGSSSKNVAALKSEFKAEYVS